MNEDPKFCGAFWAMDEVCGHPLPCPHHSKKAEIKPGHTIPVLDHGFVRYIDHLGSDLRIVEAARISYRSPSKGPDADQKLLRYLWSNKHCYAPEMQVLTADGWKRWDQCGEQEMYLVPDNGILRRETCSTVSFYVENEPMQRFKNERMSYRVTADHRMLFRKKGDDDFRIARAHEMPQWGHFKPGSEYVLEALGDPIDAGCPKMRLVGFYLGDGSGTSVGTIGFHFRKQRKKAYLREVCGELGILVRERKSSTYADGLVMTLDTPAWLRDFVDTAVKCESKRLLVSLVSLSPYQIKGILDGLINSDGSIKKDRPQIEYSSKSKALADLFQNAAAMMGFDGHFTEGGAGVFRVKAYRSGGRTSLEARKQYFSEERYSGKVYCATTSTGLLVVRGGEDKFAFVCGNTSPFEMCKLTLNVKMPIFVMRQWVRHRCQNLNEVSARYTDLPKEFYIPKIWRKNLGAGQNKQQSVVAEELPHEGFTTMVTAFCDSAYTLYEQLIAAGMARELARMVLPVNIYTEIYCCWDLKNLLHFIKLREDAHAQAEIQEYARAIKAILVELFPWTMAAYSESE